MQFIMANIGKYCQKLRYSPIGNEVRLPIAAGDADGLGKRSEAEPSNNVLSDEAGPDATICEPARWLSNNTR